MSVEKAAGGPDDGEIDTIDTPMRYLGYLGRLRAFVTRGSRYMAYTSDVGEAFRPVVPRWIVNAAYGLSFAYVAGDVTYEAYHAHRHGETKEGITRTVVQRSIFQVLASLALPAFAIHSVVHASASALKRYPKMVAAYPALRFAPTTIGLLVVPALPVMFDHPVEHVVDTVFDNVWPYKYRHPKHEKSV